VGPNQGKAVSAEENEVDWDCPACGAPNFDIVVVVDKTRARQEVVCVNCEKRAILAVSVSVHLVVEKP
jgi:transcription elongation factor Elf1